MRVIHCHVIQEVVPLPPPPPHPLTTHAVIPHSCLTVLLPSSSLALSLSYSDSGSLDGKAKVWDVYNERRVRRTYNGHSNAIRCLAFNNDGSR